MAWTNPSIADFKTRFFRDFPFGTDLNTQVLDADITNAFSYVDININQALFSDQANYNLGYLLLSAHSLVLNLRASSQGLNGQYNWLQNSKSVGGVTEAFSIPQRILDNPYLSMLSKTNYGELFLELVLPQLTGVCFGAFGPAHAL